MSRPPQSTQWLETIDAFIAGRLDAESSREFQERLRNDEQARLVYIEYLDLHFELLQGAGRLTDAESAARKAREPRYGRLLAAGAAAAAIVLVAWGLWPRAKQVAVDANPANPPVAASPTAETPSEPAPPPQIAARLVRVINARWTDSQFIPLAGDRLRVGDVLDFTSGSIELEFDSGVMACLVANEGVTARLRLTASNACQFESGCATFSVPEQARGFSVQTLGGRYVDQGTEFGVEVDPRGPSQVHVIDGRVEAIARQAAQPLMLSKGSAAALDAAGQAPVPIAFKPEAFLRPATLSWGIETYSGSIQPHLVPPPSLTRDAGLAEKATHLLLEQRGVAQSGWQNESRNVVEIVDSGKAAIGSFSVPAAAHVDSYLFHASPTKTSGRRDVSGEIHFRRPILAVITETDDLTRGRGVFGGKGVQYTNDQGYGLESIIGAGVNDRVDVIELKDDRHTLRFTLNVGNAIDQFRVLVAADDAPASPPVESEEKK